MEWTPKTNKNNPIPTFLEVWEATQGDGEMPERVRDFMARTYSAVIARELITALEQMVDKGEVTQEQLLDEARAIMLHGDDKAKQEYISKMVRKYSVTANALLVAKEGVPDDISGLLNGE
jgi:hypothetical protein